MHPEGGDENGEQPPSRRPRYQLDARGTSMPTGTGGPGVCMSLHSTFRRVGSPVAVGLTIAALIAVNTGATTAGAQQAICAPDQPVLSLANPQSGDVLPSGNIIISGEAFVPDAANGGVNRVDLFLGPRNSGGLIIGSGVPVGREFQITADVPSSMNGGRDFVAYAQAANGDEASVSVPVFIGAAPTATPTTSTAAAPVVATSSNVNCVPLAAVAAAPAPATANGAPAASAAVTGAVASAAPVLSLGNPSPRDLLPNGHLIISGTAYDPAAMSGSGIDRIEVFLDNRDEGGTFLGGAQPTGPTFSVTVDVSNAANGGHTLYAYARSSVTGHEPVVSVPVFVGTPPTPTPRPVDGA